jgi:hypothetical protein
MSGLAARLTTVLALAGLAFAATASGGSAAGSVRAPISGIVQHAGVVHGLNAAAIGAAGPDDVSLQTSPCSLNGILPCWVMHTNTTYAIYWVPSDSSVQPGYETAVNRYLSDVAAASGSQTNVYSVATQYYDATGFISYKSTFGGSYVDTDAFPTSGCSATAPHCLTDQQLQDEIQHVIGLRGWQPGPDALFFILTPDGVGSCVDSTDSECSTNFFCAYHSGFVLNGQPVIYANEPYDATIDGCHVGPSPNADDADANINTMSHEHNESITDPWGDAWLDSSGEEIADLCETQFGTPLGTSNGQPYNQLINGHPYALQEDYSNDGSTCRQSYVGIPKNTALPILSGVALQGQRLSVTQGSWTQVPTSYKYQWLRCKGTACTTIAGATSATYEGRAADGGYTLEARVSAKNSRAATSAISNRSGTVIGVPASKKAPHISGLAHVGRRLSASKGSWSGPPKIYRFQWLRCNGSGRACVHIGSATHSSYRVTKRDARHRLRVRLTASDAAGAKAATSRATARVPAA